MEVEDREPLGSARRYMYCTVPYSSVYARPAYPLVADSDMYLNMFGPFKQP